MLQQIRNWAIIALLCVFSLPAHADDFLRSHSASFAARSQVFASVHYPTNSIGVYSNGGKELHRFPLEFEENMGSHIIAITPDGKRLVRVTDRTIMVSDTVTGKPNLRVATEARLPHSVEISPDGKKFAVDYFDQVIFYQIDTLKPLAISCYELSQVTQTCWFHNSQKWMIITPFEVIVESLERSEYLLRLSATTPQPLIKSGNISPDGQHIAIVRSRGSVELYATATQTLVGTFSNSEINFDHVSWWADSQHLSATGSDQTYRNGRVVTWNAVTGDKLHEFAIANRRPFAPHITDGLARFKTTDFTVDLWDLQTGKEVLVLGSPFSLNARRANGSYSPNQNQGSSQISIPPIGRK